MGYASGPVFVSRATPCCIQQDFLHPALAAELLAFALANETKFVPARIFHGAEVRVDATARVSRVFAGPAPLIESIGHEIAPLHAMAPVVGVEPFALDGVEVEMAAHGDGAFFAAHTDLRPPDAQGRVRKLSGVYYFHAEPKGFGGGVLRLHGGGAPADVEPRHNSCVFFPPEIPHEVLRVACPSGRFADSRFAINFWFVGR